MLELPCPLGGGDLPQVLSLQLKRRRSPQSVDKVGPPPRETSSTAPRDVPPMSQNNAPTIPRPNRQVDDKRTQFVSPIRREREFQAIWPRQENRKKKFTRESCRRRQGSTHTGSDRELQMNSRHESCPSDGHSNSGTILCQITRNRLTLPAIHSHSLVNSLDVHARRRAYSPLT